MGARQVLRAGGLALAALGAATAPARAEEAPIRAGIIDLRPPSADPAVRGQLEKRLSAVEGVIVLDDPELEAALAGEGGRSEAEAVAAALDTARRAYGALDCARAAPAAEAAALGALRHLSRDQARPVLDNALAIALLCADAARDTGAARAAARRLRALSHEPPEGVSRELWDRYPPVDVTANVFVGVLEITAEPAGEVTIDLVPAGRAPVRRPLPPGRAWVTVSAPGHESFVRAVTVEENRTVTVEAKLHRKKVDPHIALRGRVRSWREAGTLPDDAALATIMRDAGIQVAVVLTAHSGNEIRALSQAAGEAVLAETPEEAVAIARAPAGAVAAGARKEEGLDERSWWIYAGAAGAVLAAGAFILVQTAGPDSQRIRVEHRP